MYQDREKRDGENFVLQNENRDLRDRIEILENVIGAQTYDVQQDAWRDLLYPTMKGSESESATTAPSEERKSEDLDKVHQPKILFQNNSAVSQMAQELVNFRKGSSAQSGEME